MKQSKFLLSFFISVLSFALLIGALIFFVNPKQTLKSNPQSPFYPYHDNFLLRKIELMETNNSFDTLILGSSTSEVIIPADMNELFNGKSFSGSIGGGQTPIRYAFFKQAQKEFPELRRLIYMVDFFEFNHLNMSGDFLYQDKLRSLTLGLLDEESVLAKFKYHLSHQVIESAISVMGKRLKDRKTVIHSDGTTQQSMILSPLKETKTPHRPLTIDQKKNLMMQVNENYYTYSNQVLNDFTKLNPVTLGFFRRIIKEAELSQIEIHFIMAPYQYDFKEMLLKDEQLQKRYQEWTEFMLSLKGDGVYVYPFHQTNLALDPLSPHWRDGIHFDRYALLKYLRENLIIDK